MCTERPSDHRFLDEVSPELEVRRVVTGHNAAGKSIIWKDGPAPQSIEPLPGLFLHEYWETTAPADNTGDADTAIRENSIEPHDPSGTIFRVVDFPPDEVWKDADVGAAFAEMGSGGAHDDDAETAGMHETQTTDFAIVLARTPKGDPVLTIALLDGVTCEPMDTVDPSRSHGKLQFNGTPAGILGNIGDGWVLAERLLDRAAVLLAFEQVGGAQRCLEMAVDYAKNRFAFGRPIGSFQAIKHKLADVFIATELARSHAYYGAWALSTDAPDLPVAAAAARVAASRAFYLASSENIQTHGGMGFTWELDCHLYYRRAKLLNLALGGERRWKHKLVSRLENRNVAA